MSHIDEESSEQIYNMRPSRFTARRRDAAGRSRIFKYKHQQALLKQTWMGRKPIQEPFLSEEKIKGIRRAFQQVLVPRLSSVSHKRGQLAKERISPSKTSRKLIFSGISAGGLQSTPVKEMPRSNIFEHEANLLECESLKTAKAGLTRMQSANTTPTQGSQKFLTGPFSAGADNTRPKDSQDLTVKNYRLLNYDHCNPLGERCLDNQEMKSFHILKMKRGIVYMTSRSSEKGFQPREQHELNRFCQSQEQKKQPAANQLISLVLKNTNKHQKEHSPQKLTLQGRNITQLLALCLLGLGLLLILVHMGK